MIEDEYKWNITLASDGDPMKTHEKIIQLLKTEGPLTASILANKLGLTTMGVRQHVQALEESEEVIFSDEKVPRGRPTRFWSLTEKGHNRFANGYDKLSNQLLDSVIATFGEDSLEQLINHQVKEDTMNYRLAIADRYGVEEKLQTLAKLRSEAGYIATIEEIEGVFWLMQNHCPIRSVATKHVGFCKSELALFQVLLSDVATVSREEYIIDGARRCAFKVIPT